MQFPRTEESHVLTSTRHVIGNGGGHFDCEQHGADLVKETGGAELGTEGLGELVPVAQIIESLAFPPECGGGRHVGHGSEGPLDIGDISAKEVASHGCQPGFTKETVSLSLVDWRFGEAVGGYHICDSLRLGGGVLIVHV